jgi:hypothetical protein
MVSAARPEMEQARVKYGRFDGVRERLNGILIKGGGGSQQTEGRRVMQGKGKSGTHLRKKMERKMEKIEAHVIMFHTPKGVFDSG